MLEMVRRWTRSVRRHLRRVEQQELREFQRWLEDAENFLRFSTVLIVPVIIGIVTWLSNVSPVISFLVYPPLASGAYMLFADPGGRYSSPRRFAGGMTLGALSGWVALEVTARFWYTVPVEQFRVHAGAAALGIFLTGVTTWLFDLEEPTAFSSALLILVTGSEELTYVAGIAVSSALVAGVFHLWRTHFYRERSRYLFRSTSSDDQVLLPIRDGTTVSHTLFAARIAAAHESGKLVLVKTVTEENFAQAELRVESAASSTDGNSGAKVGGESTLERVERQLTKQAVRELEEYKRDLTSLVDVPCEYVVAVEDGGSGETVLQAADEENCDLVVCPYETEDAALAQYIKTILSGDTDTVVFRPSNGRTEWRRILVLIRSPGQLANAMLDFAQRLAADVGTISACTCIEKANERRRAEIVLENLVESGTEPIETRIGHGPTEQFLKTNAPHYDLAVVGASTDRSAASRFLSKPTFERIHEVDCDLAIVHRG